MGKWWKIGAIVAGGGAVTVVAVVAAITLLGKESFRTVAVEEANGTTVVVSEEKVSTNAYVGMHLYSGDDVEVQAASDMTLLLDMDKYVYAEENTHFKLEASGKEGQSRTVIHLYEGSELNRLKNPLREGETFEVETPNSTMAVRGTVYRVAVWRDENGMAYTSVDVFDGAVQIDLKTEEGEYNGVSETFNAGEAALIRGNTEISEFVVGDDGSVKREIDFKALPQATAEKLVTFIDDGEELCIERDLLMDYTQLAEHDMETVSVIKEATCTEEGLEEVSCAVCHEVTENRIIPKLPHTEAGEWIVTIEPTCTEEGERQLNCTECGQVIREEAMAALGHSAGDWSVTREATCTGEGSRNRVCSVCGEIVETGAIAALGHSAGNWSVTKEATCTEAGSRRRTCSVCGEVVETGAIAALGHSAGNWSVTKEASCTEEGSRNRVCSVCGEVVETDAIAALGHSAGDWSVTKEASCTEEGSRNRVCSVCGEVVETGAIAALGHSAGDWSVTKEATCTEEGSRNKVCSVCGEVLETDNLAKLNHSVSEMKIQKEATCTTAGVGMGMCDLCKEMVMVDIPATGHDLYHVHYLYNENDDGTYTAEYVEKCHNCSYEEILEADPHIVTLTDIVDDVPMYSCSSCSGEVLVEYMD